jgi:hypothetical protein
MSILMHRMVLAAMSSSTDVTAKRKYGNSGYDGAVEWASWTIRALRPQPRPRQRTLPIRHRRALRRLRARVLREVFSGTAVGWASCKSSSRTLNSSTPAHKYSNSSRSACAPPDKDPSLMLHHHLFKHDNYLTILSLDPTFIMLFSFAARCQTSLTRFILSRQQ